MIIFNLLKRLLINMGSLLKLLMKTIWSKLESIVTLLIGIATIYIATNQFETSTSLQRLQNKMNEQELNIVEGELVANLLPSLIQGNESEKEMAIWILQSKAPNSAKEILQIIYNKEENPTIKKRLKHQLEGILYINNLKTAQVYFEISRFNLAAEYYSKASAFLDTSRVDMILLNSAKKRYKLGSDSLATILFREIFSNYEKNKETK